MFVLSCAGGARLVVKHRADVAAPASASATAAAVCGPVVWLLLKAPRGGVRLVGFDRQHGRLCATAALAEAGMLPHRLVKDPEGGDAMLMVRGLRMLRQLPNACHLPPFIAAADKHASPTHPPHVHSLAALSARASLGCDATVLAYGASRMKGQRTRELPASQGTSTHHAASPVSAIICFLITHSSLLHMLPYYACFLVRMLPYYACIHVQCGFTHWSCLWTYACVHSICWSQQQWCRPALSTRAHSP